MRVAPQPTGSGWLEPLARRWPFADWLLACLLLLLPGCRGLSNSERAPAVVFENQYLIHAIEVDGKTSRFADRSTGQNYAASNRPCAHVRRGGKSFSVTRAEFRNDLLSLSFAQAQAEAVVRVTDRTNYFVWEVVSLTGRGIDEFIFADVPLALRGSAGEPFAATALALNLKTQVKEMPQPVGRLTASCVSRFGYVGAQVALIGCPPSELRRVLQDVVTAAPELPKSALGGPWAWDAPATRGSYLFDFGQLNEQTVEDWIQLVKSLGFTQIDFHGGRSFRFGDCRVNPEVFPRGREGFKAVIDKLHAAGISAGLHTYAFFIDKKSGWVAPIPDPRLASDKTFTLAEDTGVDSATLAVKETTEMVSAITGFFVRNSVTLRVEDELITYAGATKTAPYRFTGCKRGAYGTRASPHRQGTKVDHLKECFGLFVPDPETSLLAEVAQHTAAFYNECGFDMIYLDALDGEDILGGDTNSWHYGSRFVFELAKRLRKPALMEMSTFHHHLWCVRSRAGAWDHPRRAQKEFIDLHLTANEGSHRMFLPANLGWWAVKNWSGAQEERTFPDDIEYLCGKALATDSGLSLMGIDPKNAAGMARVAAIFKRYEILRQSNQAPEVIKEKLRVPGAEFRLLELEGGGWEFRPVRYDAHKVETHSDWMVTNRFESQRAGVRIEALMAAGSWEAASNAVLAGRSAADAFTNRASAPGVSAEFGLAEDAMPSGRATFRFSATNASGSARGAWTKVERTFAPPLNLSGSEGLGLWVHGDGHGELLNLQLRSPEYVVAGIGDHYIVIDFTGWRYFELVEPESRRWARYKWPYGDPYSIYRESVSFSQVSSLSIWFNEIPPGKAATCYLSELRALPLVKSVLRHPAVTIGNGTVRFPIELETGSYLECQAESACKVYGPNDEVKAEIAPEGEMPVLGPGPSLVKFSCEPGGGGRARVTVITEGAGKKAQ